VKDLGDFAVNIEGRICVPTDTHRVYKSDMTKLIKGEIVRHNPPITPALPNGAMATTNSETQGSRTSSGETLK